MDAGGSMEISGGSIEAGGEAIRIEGDVTVRSGRITGSGEYGYAIHSLDGEVTISGGTVEATGTGVFCAAISSNGKVTISGGKVTASPNSDAIHISQYGAAAYLSGTCSGSFTVAENMGVKKGLIVEVDKLVIPGSRNNTAIGLTVKDGSGQAMWNTDGVVPEIVFTLAGDQQKTLAWGEKTSVKEPAITGLTANPKTMAAAGGDSTILVTGIDLPAAITVTAFDGLTPTTITGTTGGASTAVTLKFPANTSATLDKAYTIKASPDGGITWAAITTTVTVSKAEAEEPPIGGGGGGGGAPSTDAAISPAQADFDLNGGKDISVTLALNGRSLKNLNNGAYTLQAGADYVASGKSVTIKGGYLSTLAAGTHTIVFEMNGGVNPLLYCYG
jgi:hypothetical protein